MESLGEEDDDSIFRMVKLASLSLMNWESQMKGD